MTRKNSLPIDGGFAFPVPPALPMSDGKDRVAHTGMTLRDYFAAQVLGHMLTQASPWPEAKFDKWFAERAYRYADALLAQRAKP